jgi:PAS domain S-box-containing protein
MDYGLSFVAIMLAVMARWLLDPLVGNSMPLSTLYAAVAFAVWLGGWRPAALSAVAGFVMCDYWFMEPRGTLALGDASAAARTVAYLVTCAVIIGFGEALRRAQQRSAEAAVTARESEANQRQSQALKTATFEAALDCIISIDHQGRIIEFNPAAERTFGFRRGDVLGLEIGEVVIPPSQRERHRRGLANYLATGKGPILNQQLEMPALRADGSEIPVEMSVTRIPIDGPPLFTAHVRDISDRKRAEQRLRTQYSVTRALAESGTLSVAATPILLAICEHLGWQVGTLWYVDQEDNVLRCSEVYHPPSVRVPQFEATSRQRTFTLGIGLPGRVWASGQASWIPDVVQDNNFPRAPIADAEGLHGAFGFPILLNNDVLGVLEFFSHEIRQPDEDLLQMMTAIGAQIGQFIERKRAEAALKAKEAELQLVANTTPLTLTRCSRDLHYLFANRAAATMFGLTPDQMIGKPIVEVMGEPMFALVRPRIEQVLRGEAVEYEAELQYPGVGKRWVRVNYMPERDEHHDVVGWVASIVDISKRKRAEDALREADRRKDEFLATLAHELRNPLAPIQNALEIMKDASLDGEALRNARQMIERQFAQLVRLVDDLLDVSRITRDKLELRRERVEIKAVINQAIETCLPLIQRSQQKLKLNLSEVPIFVDADPVRLAQVFANLINNASKYTQPQGNISVSAERLRSDVAVTVKDSGAGIPSEMLPKVFDLFTQVDTSIRGLQGGLGIGLSLVKRLVEMHGGSVEARSDGPDLGSEFVVRLPVTVDMPYDLAPQPKLAAPTPAECRILIVDDNRDAAHSLAMLLRKFGNETYLAHDGLEAIDAAAQLRPDAVLLDIGLPKMNGYDVCRAIRQQPWGRSMVIIAVTGWGQDEDRRRSDEAGFNAHLVKPVDHVALSSLLAELQLVPA